MMTFLSSSKLSRLLVLHQLRNFQHYSYQFCKLHVTSLLLQYSHNSHLLSKQLNLINVSFLVVCEY